MTNYNVMIKNMVILIFSLIVMNTMAQDNITVCHASAIEKFALFAADKNFNAMHPDPKPFVFTSAEGGEMIKVKCPDGTDANAYLIKAKTTTDNWIFVFQEWWGLNDYIKRESEKLFKDVGNVNVLALDMYDGKVAADRETASKYVQAYRQERGDNIVKGALDYVGKKAKVATIGWCFGGGLSMQAALTAGNQAVACVIYYGMPEEDVNRLRNLNCDVLMIWPTKDKRINKDVVDKFQANMKTANKKLTVLPYDADHAFANPSNDHGYNEDATKDAYKHVLEFLRIRLK